MKLLNVTALIGAGVMAVAGVFVPTPTVAQECAGDICLSGETLEVCASYDVSGKACACYVYNVIDENGGTFTADDVNTWLSWAYEDAYYGELLQGCVDANP